jgi:hypothetical protein
MEVQGALGEEKTKIKSPFQITEHTLSDTEMSGCGTMKELTQLVDCEGDVGLCKCAILKGTNDVAVQGRLRERITIGCKKPLARGTRGRVGLSTIHVDMPQQVHDIL